MKSILWGSSALALSVVSANAATFTLTTYFDNSEDDALTAPYMGTFTLSYTAASPLADGNYALSSIPSASLLADFNTDGGGTVTTSFTQADLGRGNTNPAIVHVQITGSAFYLTSTTGEPINFANASGYSFVTEPTDNDSISGYRGINFDRQLYQFAQTAQLGQSTIYFGNYGGSATLGRDTPAVPEPSTYGLMLGGLSLAAAAIMRRRRKA